MNRFIIPQRLSEYAKALIFCEKQPLLHTNLESYAKVLRFEKPTGFAGRRFRAFQSPKIIPLYPALKSTACNPPQNRSKSRRFSLKNHRFFHSGLLYCLCIKNAKVESKIKSTDAQYKYLNFFTIDRAVFYINQALILKRFYCSSYTFVTHIALLSHSSY